MANVRTVLGMVGLAVSSHLAAGQSQWLNPVSGNWNTAGNWTAGIPNGPAALAQIAVAGAYTVTLNISIQLFDLSLTNPSAAMHILNGLTLTNHGPSMLNDGVILVNPASGGSGTLINFAESSILGSSPGSFGQVVLSAHPGNTDTAYLATAGGKVLTNAASHTIRGTGSIHAQLDNLGDILADQDGRILRLASSAKINRALIEALAGGQLRIDSITVSQENDALIHNHSGSVTLSNATISDGLLGAAAGRSIDVSGAATLTGSVETFGAITIPNGSFLIVNQATWKNDGVVTVNPTAGGNASYIRFDQDTTTDGAGTFTLNANTGNLDTAYLINSGPRTLFLHDQGAIRGTGRVYLPVVNSGLIHADAPGKILELNSSNKTNHAVIQATGGGLLRISGITVTQSSTGVIKTAGTDLTLNNATISGGTIEATGGGRIDVSGAATLTGNAKTSGPTTIPNGTLLIVNQATWKNDGVVTVNPTAGGNASYIRFDQDTTTDGAGTFTLNANTGNLDTAYLINSGPRTLFLHDQGAIRGTGRVYLPVVNSGLIHADAPGKILELNSSNKTNHAVIQATGGGLLRISGITVTQSSTGVIKTAGTDLTLNNATISGGTIEATGGGGLAVSGSATLTGGVNFFGPAHIPSGSFLVINQPETLHSGVLTVNTAAGDGATSTRFSTASRIDGGEILLNANAGNLDTAYLQAMSGLVTLGGQETLRGLGRLYGPFANHGATSPGVNPGAIGRLECMSSFTMGDDAVLEIDVGGVSPSQFDRLVGSTSIHVGGTIRARLTNGYEPIGGETFDIVTAPSRTGFFTYFDIEQYPGGAKKFAVKYLPGKVQLLARGCSADFDGSGFVDTDDYDAFVYAFELGGDDADFDGSGFVDTDDFTAFVLAFMAGC
ncbi:MAG TPA: hypothetical protein PKU91_02725 [Phycisphaerales bacterium]|nr:hypothetical protein [Phycisphaerales bacterium]